ncbi:hypothetical protein UA08_09045 [Talaromyces atroroseus]|uniref:Epoxide hydrolase N-terminal domain-containing protein n=1 Tax=Talaromyces atroroseus TaxID=1441469 RepID=A0A1Q5Q7P2_TALAT|nr:hypothetical protein UA08_09045 [Talaromyces atroroseus]OKL55691.1 hypothetical protein UA08_09045 [Talaromyces atroroseus]
MTTSRFLHPLSPAGSSQRPFGHPPPNARESHKHEPCKVNITTQDITELRTLVQQARLGPVTFENSSRSDINTVFGMTRSWLSKAIEAWGSDDVFDCVPNFSAQVDHDDHSYSIHYMALFSKRPDALPLICLHGWPGCFLEYLPMAKLLQSKYTPESLPYHFIVPSLPGYTFSSGPPISKQDFSTYDVSCIFRNMFAQLGFDATGYVVSGGDIGSRVARALAVDDESCVGIHLNFCFDLPMHTFPRQNLSIDDIHRLDKLDTFISTGAGYAQMHATRAATIGLVLSSSPVALLAWIAEKFGTWTDKNTTPDTNTILTFVTLYWLTDTFPRSIYPYRTDFAPREDVPAHGDSVRWRIPDGKLFGFSHFPHEILPVPRAWVERTGSLTFWREHDAGGHFAALEVAQSLLRDLEVFIEEVKQNTFSK